MAPDSLDPRFSTSQSDITPNLLKSAQAYVACRRDGRLPTDGLSQEWEKFYQSCAVAIRCFAVRCGAPSVADCSQDVWKTLVVKLPEFQNGPGQPPFFSWLYKVVRNRVIDQIRERSRHPTKSLAGEAKEPVSPSEVDPAAEWDRQSLRSRVHQVLGELEKQIPELNYRILYLHWIEGRTMSEIAAFLNLRIEQVWTRHHRAKRKFRSLFERSGHASREEMPPRRARAEQAGPASKPLGIPDRAT